MPSSLEEKVDEILESDEPDYSEAGDLGPEALPHLKEIVLGDDPGLSSKATHLASLIKSPDVVSIMEAASQRMIPEVRVAAAAALANLPTPLQVEGDSLADEAPVSGVLFSLLGDQDIGVRKAALQSIARLGDGNVIDKVRDVAQHDPVNSIRLLANDTLTKLSE